MSGLAKFPLAKCPLAKCPLAKCPDTAPIPHQPSLKSTGLER